MFEEEEYCDIKVIENITLKNRRTNVLPDDVIIVTSEGRIFNVFI